MTIIEDEIPTTGATTIFASRDRALLDLQRFVKADAYPVVPDRLLRALDAGDKIGEAVEEQRRALPFDFGKAVRDLADDMLAGDLTNPRPRLLEQIEQHVNAATIAAETARALDTLRMSVEREAKAAVDTATEDLLEGLRGRFDAMLADVEAASADLGDLDVQDPDKVSEATDTQRAAMIALARMRRDYKALRAAHRAIYEASTHRPPNQNAFVNGSGWTEIFNARIHEFGDIPRLGEPATTTSSPLWHRALTTRPDVWLPTTDELFAAWWAYDGRRLVDNPSIEVSTPTPAPAPRPSPGSLLLMGDAR